ncbi:polysaccharide lyase family 7 protein [Aquipseudomonas ullengensis]|uniref:Polysaccharide lyase family 7 protein n=1 Tax=Aquipseudomonas ullengensis TaxID=2759166 RepID=A0A7W4QC87_9GAMM|nr:polysaccharide lyase family 7 protein [Pseudomonas ullengensis]MBB2494701.1 polysaccharide lyase family 7 protein [Pseudomonas ullengensis]
MRRPFICLSLGLLVLGGCGKDQEPQRDYAAPGSNYDLSHWKLTLPDDQASEVRAEKLEAGYASRYFHLSESGAMVFIAPAGAGTTKNSDYPRSELREVLDPADDNRNWSGSGFHQLKASCRVMQAPSTEKIIVGQIHGFDARPLVKLQWQKGKLRALIKQHPKGDNEDLSHTFSVPVNNDLFSYSIEVRDGVLSVEANGERFSHDFYAADPAWRDVAFYFKAGAYVQDDDGSADEVGEVQFTELAVHHGG